MHPFIAAELGQDFSLESALRLGMLPVVRGSLDSKEALETYVSLYIVEEVQFEGLVRNIGSFARFLSVIAFSHAGLLNVVNIANECEVKRNTVADYIGILQDLLLAYLLPVFTNRAQRNLVSHPKFYLFDAGVFRVLRGIGPADKSSELDGIALEGLVLQHLRAWCDYSKKKFEIFYWRTKAGLEVDFIVYGEGGFWAIEVKNSGKVSSKDVRGLLHFQEDYPESKLILLHRGAEKWMEKGVLCFPCETFLKQMIPDMTLFA
jgi:predicted AAA+ superfamily ATPase